MIGQLFRCSPERRFIWLQLFGTRTIDEGIAEQFCGMLKRLDEQSTGPIIFYLSGTGGDFYACLKMAHAIHAARSPVVVVPFHRVRSGCFMLTQAGTACYAMLGTKFVFHHATDYFLGRNLKDRKLSQLDYESAMRKLRLIDASQLLLFTQRARPIRRIYELFDQEATLSLRDALALKLASGRYASTDFLRDRTEALRLARLRS